MGFLELLVLVLVVLLFFGAGKLPALGEGLGKAIRGFKEAVRSDGAGAGAPPAAKKELPGAPGEPKP
jgi:sec-independent protein translocase protein TatA